MEQVLAEAAQRAQGQAVLGAAGLLGHVQNGKRKDGRGRQHRYGFCRVRPEYYLLTACDEERKVSA